MTQRKGHRPLPEDGLPMREGLPKLKDFRPSRRLGRNARRVMILQRTEDNAVGSGSAEK
jgi:hypothetical protein